MHIKHRSLYASATPRIPVRIKVVLCGIAALLPYGALTNSSEHTEPYAQDFVITAYYSPLPGQCCYVTGGYKADKVLNGEGIRGADGTEVYPGMIAAPSSYTFGTVVSLPGLGSFTVHDRGGAIVELGAAHRLDIWAGHGEEGLARALAFGVRRIKGTVYPLQSGHPATAFSLDTLPSPIDRLEAFFVERDNLLALRPKLGETGLSVSILQEHLLKLGYFHRAVTGFYGEETQSALRHFLADFGLNDSDDTLTETSAAYLLGAMKRLDAEPPVSGFINDESAPESVVQAQRILRFLGFYKGRTDGVYGETLKTAILEFQKRHALVGTAEDPGAGRIGPITLKSLTEEWNKRIVGKRAKTAMDLYRTEHILSEKGRRIDQFLEEGYSGTQVKILQQMLTDRGFFPSDMINSFFGPLTKDAVSAYQVERGIVPDASFQSAGIVGPETLRALRNEERLSAFRLVRERGWKAL